MDVRTSEIKLQLNNAAGGRLYFTRPHIPETEIKQNCRRSAETKQFCFSSFLFRHVRRAYATRTWCVDILWQYRLVALAFRRTD